MNKEALYHQYVQGFNVTAAQLSKGIADTTGLIVLGLAGMEIIPAAAAIFTVVWMFFRMIETGVRVYRMLFVKDGRRQGDKS